MSDILVVEDDEDIRVTTLEFLEMEGFSAFGCVNGQAALDFLSQPHSPMPKLMLVDLTMPIMDGIQFRERVVLEPKMKDIPFVVMSGDGRIDMKCKNLGIEHCLKKPVDLDDLLAMVQKYVSF